MSRSTQIYGLNPAAREFLRERALPDPLKADIELLEKFFQEEYHRSAGRPIVQEAWSRLYPRTCILVGDQRARWADASDEGMFEDGPSLFCWPLTKDLVAYEMIQRVHWSSGPMIFTTLVVKPKGAEPPKTYRMDDLDFPLADTKIEWMWKEAEMR